MNDLRTWFAKAWQRLIAVQARDEEEARLGRLFNTLMVISTGIVVALSMAFLLMPPLGLLGARLSWTAAAFPLAFIPLSIFCLAQARHGHIRSMVGLYVWVNLFAIGAAAWLFDGIYSSAWLLFIWTITVAGILLTPAYALWMTGGVVSYFLLLLVMTGFGSYTPPLTFGDAGREFVHMAVLMIMLVSTVGLLTYLNMRSLRNALERLRKEIAEHQQTEKKLGASEQKFMHFFMGAPIALGVVNSDGVITYFNDRFTKVFGYTTADLPTIADWWQQAYPDEAYRQRVMDSWGEAAAKAAREGTDIELAGYKVTCKSGAQRLTEIGGFIFGDNLLATFVDVTERKRAEDEIKRLNEALEAKVLERTKQLMEAQEELLRKEKLAVLGQVAGSVGHELRNPLGVMSNAVYFLQTVLADADDSVKEYLNIIKSEIAGSQRIVSDLLDSVRTKPPQPEIVGVRELLEQTLRKCNVPPSVTVKLDIPESLPPLRVDPLQIHQVLRNLISNAQEAMPEGGTLKIHACENRPDGSITVKLRDSGVGMTAEQLGKLFQPLFTTKARGIGLGLVVAKNLTQANGGSVQVESQVGQGSQFSVTLPAATVS